MPCSNEIKFNWFCQIVIWSWFWCFPSVCVAIAIQLGVIYWKITRYIIYIGWRCDWNIAVICGCVWTWTTIKAFFSTWTVCQILWVAWNKNPQSVLSVYLARELVQLPTGFGSWIPSSQNIGCHRLDQKDHNLLGIVIAQ